MQACHDLVSVNKSPRAAKAQDCSAVSPVPPNRACDKALQPVGRAGQGFGPQRFFELSIV